MKTTLAVLVIIAAGTVPTEAGADFPALPMDSRDDPATGLFSVEAETDMSETVRPADPEPQMKKISKTRAVVYSVLLPGAGHLYLNETGRGEVFLGAEVVSWAGFFVFRTLGSWKEDDYIRYATEHAGIDPEGKDDDFYKNLTFYDSRDDYNTAGRIINPGASPYPNTRSYYWQWDSENSQNYYRDLRNSSENSFRNATFMIVGAIINRVLAGIDSFRLASRLAGRGAPQIGSTDGGTSFKFSAKPFSSNPRISVSVTRRF